MNIGDVGGDNPSQTFLAQLSNGAGSASEELQRAAPSSGTCQIWMKKEVTEKTVDILNDLRDKGQLCDAVIRLGETSFLVHRNVLSACSPYFKALFTSKGFRVPRDPFQLPQEVELTDVVPEVLGCLIDYAYSRPVVITEDNVQTIFHTADRFLMSSLADSCCEFLRGQLCAENCLGIASFARGYFRPDLEKSAMHFAHRHFTAIVTSSQEFLELDGDCIYELIRSDYLNVPHEEAVFEAVCKWIYHDPANRRSEMPRMLRGVRLGLLSTQYLMERIKVHDLVRTSDQAKAVVVEALKHVCNLEVKGLAEVETVSPMTIPRVPHEILFVIGGWSGGSPTDIIETYDPRADHWLVCRPPDSEPRAYHACVTLNQMIYVVGGFNGVEYFNSCRKFNPMTFCWTEAPPMHSKRCYVSAAELQGRLYAMGGFDGHVRLNTAERFDPSTNQWSFVFPMIQQRSDAKASVLNNKIYICGGFNGQECLNTAEYYDPCCNQWTMISPMRNRRSGVGVLAYHGCIYALGGFNGITRMNTAERYNPDTRLWSSIPEMFSPRSNFAVGVSDELLFVIGGFNGVTTISQVECFDSTTDEWCEVTGLSLFRSALSACVVKDLPNITDFVFKSRTPATMRKRPTIHTTDRHNDPSSPSAASAADGEGSPSAAQQANDNLLNQLA